MASRNGKVANLPSHIREQLNLRLLEGESHKELAAWLNALPDVQSVLGLRFNGSPISEVNLIHWGQGGYLQWVAQRECFHSARALAEGDCNLAETGLAAERLLNILTLRYGELLMRWDFSSDENVSETAPFSEVARKARILQGISRSVLAIHRIQSQSGGSKTERERSPVDSAARSGSPGAGPTSAFPSQPPIGVAQPPGSQNVAASDASPKSAQEPNRLSTERPPISAEANGKPFLPAFRHGKGSAPAEGQSRDQRRECVEGLAAHVEAAEPQPVVGDAALRRFRAARKGGRPEILSGAISPATIPSDLSETPFKAEADLAGVLSAV